MSAPFWVILNFSTIPSCLSFFLNHHFLFQEITPRHTVTFSETIWLQHEINFYPWGRMFHSVRGLLLTPMPTVNHWVWERVKDFAGERIKLEGVWAVGSSVGRLVEAGPPKFRAPSRVLRLRPPVPPGFPQTHSSSAFPTNRPVHPVIITYFCNSGLPKTTLPMIKRNIWSHVLSDKTPGIYDLKPRNELVLFGTPLAEQNTGLFTNKKTPWDSEIFVTCWQVTKKLSLRTRWVYLFMGLIISSRKMIMNRSLGPLPEPVF